MSGVRVTDYEVEHWLAWARNYGEPASAPSEGRRPVSESRRPDENGPRAIRQPCKSCPWRVDQSAADIPNFSLELAEGLRRTCDGQFGSPVFACHQSREGEEFACAGWLAVYGYDSIAIRLMVAAGRMPVEALEPGLDWPELHRSFDDLIEKLRETIDV